MLSLKYVKPESLDFKDYPELNERWVQEKVAEDPSLLGLGDLILKDKERIQTHAGRLDLLLQDAETSHRYEVEIQLGKTDESHIIRTIEYWDIERKRYPQYEHTAVIIAEDMTSRFLNVISLFNGFIPLIAIQMQVLKVGEQVSLGFTKVLDEMQWGLDDVDDVAPEADRAYWEKRGSDTTLAMADQLLSIIQSWDPSLEFKYNKFYVGLARKGQPFNFVTFRPQKSALRIEPRLEKSAAMEERLDVEGLDVMEYDSRWGRYRIRLGKGDIKSHEEFITELLKTAYEEATTG